MRKFLPYLVIALLIVGVWFFVSSRQSSDAGEAPTRVVPTESTEAEPIN